MSDEMRFYYGNISVITYRRSMIIFQLNYIIFLKKVVNISIVQAE